jgi:hypothetical protein
MEGHGDVHVRLGTGTNTRKGSSGHPFEVNAEFETIWEYVNPYYGRRGKQNGTYRAHRVPYDWVPQTEPPREKAIGTINNAWLRVPGSPRARVLKITDIKNRSR